MRVTIEQQSALRDKPKRQRGRSSNKRKMSPVKK